MKTLLTLLLLFIGGSISAQHTLPPLPYGENALEPVMSRETIEYHHGKHVRAYVDKLNNLIPGTRYADASLEEIVKTADGPIFDNGAQILNHIIFFDSFAPEDGARKAPMGDLARAIDRDFGSFDQFKAKFKEAALAQFGSGWAWPVNDHSGKLSIVTTGNAGNPIREDLHPLLGIDVWEHSYYIDYRNDRGKYLDNLWRVIDWTVMEYRFDNR